jgi:hypothetical protein
MFETQTNKRKNSLSYIVNMTSKTGTSKVKVKVKFTLEQATKAVRERRSIAVLFL